MECNYFHNEMTVESSGSVTMKKLFEVIHALLVLHQIYIYRYIYLRSNIVL